MIYYKKKGVPKTTHWMILRILGAGYTLNFSDEVSGRSKVVLGWSTKFGSYYYETFYQDEFGGIGECLTAACEWLSKRDVSIHRGKNFGG